MIDVATFMRQLAHEIAVPAARHAVSQVRAAVKLQGIVTATQSVAVGGVKKGTATVMIDGLGVIANIPNLAQATVTNRVYVECRGGVATIVDII